MLLCRTVRLSAAALDQAFQRPGSFLVRVKVSGPRDVVLSARPGCAFQRHRLFCSSVAPDRAHLEKEVPQAGVLEWDASAAFVTAEWGHLNRVATVAVNLSEFNTTRHNNMRRDAKGAFLFTGNTATVQTRAASTNTPTKKSADQADVTKGDLQEASATSATEENLGGKPEPEEGKLSKTQQLKKVFKEYGAVGVSFHIGISLMSLGMFYLLISSGIDMAALLCKVGFSEAVVQSKMAAGTSTFVLAYAVHKLFAPVRISITLVSVPLIVRYFRKTGLFKPPTPAP